MQFPTTKNALKWGAGWIVIGAIAGSSQMAAGGVCALLILTPLGLLGDWWTYRRLMRHERRMLSVRRGPQLLLSPPE